MFLIDAERMTRYRDLISGLGIPEDRKDHLIQAVGDILQSFIDRAWGSDPIQTLEHNRLKSSFHFSDSHAKLPSGMLNSETAEQIDLRSEFEREGAINPNKKKRGWRHAAKHTTEGSHLLPRI